MVYGFVSAILERRTIELDIASKKPAREFQRSSEGLPVRGTDRAIRCIVGIRRSQSARMKCGKAAALDEVFPLLPGDSREIFARCGIEIRC